MSKLIEQLEKEQIKDMPDLAIGSTLRVNFRIKEGEKERVQPFEGVLIAKHAGKGNIRATFTVRKVSSGFGIERVFPLHSPRIDSIEVKRLGKVRRAKLYYLRQRFGKAARIPEKLTPRT